MLIAEPTSCGQARPPPRPVPSRPRTCTPPQWLADGPRGPNGLNFDSSAAVAEVRAPKKRYLSRREALILPESLPHFPLSHSIPRNLFHSSQPVPPQH